MEFLDKKNINNFEKIINIINSDENFEHIGDIVFLLDKHDKKRENDSLELKQAVYTIIKTITQNNNFKAIRFLNDKKKLTYENINDSLSYLDENWDSSDIREYLLFFQKKL